MKKLNKKTGRIISMILMVAMMFSVGTSVMAGEVGSTPPPTANQEQEQSAEARQACYSCGTGTLQYSWVETEYSWNPGSTVRYTREVYIYVCYSCGFQTAKQYTDWHIG